MPAAIGQVQILWINNSIGNTPSYRFTLSGCSCEIPPAAINIRELILTIIMDGLYYC